MEVLNPEFDIQKSTFFEIGFSREIRSEKYRQSFQYKPCTETSLSVVENQVKDLNNKDSELDLSSFIRNTGLSQSIILPDNDRKKSGLMIQQAQATTFESKRNDNIKQQDGPIYPQNQINPNQSLFLNQTNLNQTQDLNKTILCSTDMQVPKQQINNIKYLFSSCTQCKVNLRFPDDSRKIKCPNCNLVIGIAKCNKCQSVLIYKYGAKVIMCFCKTKVYLSEEAKLKTKK